MKPLVEQDEMFPESSSSWDNEEVSHFFCFVVFHKVKASFKRITKLYMSSTELRGEDAQLLCTNQNRN